MEPEKNLEPTVQSEAPDYIPLDSSADIKVLDTTKEQNEENEIKIELENVKNEEKNEEEEEDLPEDFFDDFADIEFMEGLNVIDTWESEANESGEINDSTESNKSAQDDKRKNEDNKTPNKSHNGDYSKRDSKYKHERRSRSNSIHKYRQRRNRDRSPIEKRRSSRSDERRRFEPPQRRYKPSPIRSPYASRHSDWNYRNKSRSRSPIRDRRSKYSRGSYKNSSEFLLNLSLSPLPRESRSMSPRRGKKRSPFLHEIQRTLREHSKKRLLAEANPPIPGEEQSPHITSPGFPIMLGANPENPNIPYSYAPNFMPNSIPFDMNHYVGPPAGYITPQPVPAPGYAENVYPNNMTPQACNVQSSVVNLTPVLRPDIISAVPSTDKQNESVPNKSEVMPDVRKLFAEKKISLSEFLTMSAKGLDSAVVPQTKIQNKVLAITRCEDAIARLDVLENPRRFPSKFFYNDAYNKDFSRIITPISKYTSPLRLAPIIKFKYTTADPNMRNKSERIQKLLNALGMKLNDEPKIEETKKKTLLKKVPEVQATLNDTSGDGLSKNVFVQTNVYSCDKCEIRERTVMCNKSVQTDAIEFQSPSKSLFTLHSGQMMSMYGNGNPLSVLTPQEQHMTNEFRSRMKSKNKKGKFKQ